MAIKGSAVKWAKWWGLMGTIRHSTGTEVHTVSAKLKRQLTHPE